MELAFGGVAPKAIMAPETEAALCGKAWNRALSTEGSETAGAALLTAAAQALAEDVNITANAPGVCRHT